MKGATKIFGALVDLNRKTRYKASFDEAQFRGFFAQLGAPNMSVFDGDPTSLLTDLFNASKGFDTVFILESDSDFYHLEENKAMLLDFETYDCDIGFGDHFPEGVVGYAVKRAVLPVLENLRREKQIGFGRRFLHDLIHIDVNMFDLENRYAPIDLRTLRLSFFEDSLQNNEVVKSIKTVFPLARYNSSSFAEFGEALLRHRPLFRVPAKYYEIEVSTDCEQSCVFCPRTAMEAGARRTRFMSGRDYETLLSKVVDAVHEPVVAFSGMGDAGKNPEFLDILRHTLERGVGCYWETSGCELTPQKADAILSLPNQEKLVIIFSIDAVDEALYNSLRPSRHSFKQTLSNIEYVLLRKRKTTYVQAVKMNENVDHLLDFHRHFKAYTNNIIIQKYNHYKGFLPERRTNPMRPFDRIDCWHLKRDMSIDVEGNVRVCKQDLGAEHVLGNLLTEPYEVVHARGQKHFERHLKGWEFCKGCDEFYTYNE